MLCQLERQSNFEEIIPQPRIRLLLMRKRDRNLEGKSAIWFNPHNKYGKGGDNL